MLIDRKMTDGLNQQIGREYGAAMEYLAMGAWFDEQGLSGFANFFYKQGAEENEHGFKIVRYLAECGAHVAIPAIPKPQDTYESVLGALEKFLSMEQGVTRAIFELVELAQSEKDHSAFQFLQWYVAEQREEVSSATALLDKARHYSEERIAILDGALG